MEDEFLELGLKGIYRQGAILLVLASVLVTPFLCRAICEIFKIDHIQEHLYWIYAVVVPLSLFCLWWAYHWRIVIDRYGVHRREFLYWQHWPWELFEEGQARRGDTYFSFKFMFEAFHRRELDFKWAEDHLARQALDICYAHWTPPPRPPVPDEVKFKAQRHPRTSWFKYNSGPMQVRASHRGVWIDDVALGWHEITHFVFFRPSREHEGFTAFYFQARARPLKYEEHWNRNRTKEIARLFEACARPDEVVVCTEDAPETVREADERVKVIREKVKAESLLGIVFASSMGLYSYIFVFLELTEMSAADVLGLLVFAFSIAKPVWARHKHEREIKELLAERERLMKATSGRAEPAERWSHSL